MAKNKFFLTTKGFNAEVVVAAPLAYSTQATYALFLANAAEGEIGIYNQDTSALISAPAATVGTPGTVTPTAATTGGTLATATYYFKAVAVNATGVSIASAEANAAVTGPTGSVGLSYTAVTGATSYRIYVGTAAGAETGYFVTTSITPTYTGQALTNATVPTASFGTAPIGANIFIAQKRDGLINKTTPFKAASGIVTYTPYAAPVKQVTTISTFPAVAAGKVWSLAVFDMTPEAQPYPAWDWDYYVKSTDTIATALAGLAALINDATNPQNAAYGQLVTATVNGSGDTSTLALTTPDFERPFRVATRQDINYLTAGVTVTLTTPFQAGIGIYDNVAEVEGEGIIFSGVTTNYPSPTNALPSEFGTAALFAVSGKTYNTYLINFYETEFSPLPLERHFQRKYMVLFTPSSGTTPDSAINGILNF